MSEETLGALLLLSILAATVAVPAAPIYIWWARRKSDERRERLARSTLLIAASLAIDALPLLLSRRPRLPRG